MCASCDLGLSTECHNPPPRAEAEVLAELTEANARAKRMPYFALNYGPTHALINELITELEEARRGTSRPE
jgi:hypothetical protein